MPDGVKADALPDRGGLAIEAQGGVVLPVRGQASRRWRSFPGSIERMGSRSDHQQEAEPLRLRSPFRFDNGTRRQAQMPHAAFRQERAPCSDAMQVANPSNDHVTSPAWMQPKGTSGTTK